MRKGCDRMNRRRYRKFLLWCLGLDILAMGWLGYRYIDRKVPDEIYVSEGENQKVAQLLEHPLLKFEDAIAVSGEGSYLLPCRLLGLSSTESRTPRKTDTAIHLPSQSR